MGVVTAQDWLKIYGLLPQIPKSRSYARHFHFSYIKSLNTLTALNILLIPHKNQLKIQLKSGFDATTKKYRKTELKNVDFFWRNANFKLKVHEL